MKDFFVSYNSADQTWAEWIAWVLEENGYTVVIQAWDFRPGGNFILDMQRAAEESHRTIMMLSEAYLKARYTQPEWAAAFKQDPTAEERRLIPIRVARCRPTGMLAPLVYVDLVDKTEAEAEQLVLDALKDRAKPATRPSFPDSTQAAERVTDQKIEFPGLATAPNNLPRSGAVAFVGREEDLADLHTQLHQTSRIAITALRGMGGIGKTELALQYALHHRDRGTYPGGICWLQAKEQDVGTEIVNFAQVYLGLTPPDELDLSQQVAYIWKHWPKSATPDAVLVVFDDVSGIDDIAAYKAIKPYLPPQENRFRVLLTTRLQLGASIQTVPIDVLSEAASLELLRSLMEGDRVDRELDTAKALGEWLGYLPLGLELVGRFLARKPTWSLTKMQQRLNDKRLEAKALCQAQPDMTAAHEGIAAAFELSWQDLEEPVQELAYRLCLFASAPIPWTWIESWYGDDDTVNNDELEEWCDEGLVNRSLLNRVDENIVQLHRLIRDFFRGKLGDWTGEDIQKRYLCGFLGIIASRIPKALTSNQIQVVAPVVPHISEVANIWHQWIDEKLLISVFTGLGWFYEGQGSYTQAETWLEKGLNIIRNRLGENHSQTANSLHNLAALNQLKGCHEKAIMFAKYSLELNQKLYDEDHSDVASSLNTLATAYQSQGRYMEAESLYRSALSMLQRLFGGKHPNIASSLNNIACLYELKGLYEEAEILFLEALSMLQDVYNEEHPNIASSLMNLARLYNMQERYSEAESFYLNALEMRVNLFDDTHYSVADSLNELAKLYAFHGKYDEAENLSRSALDLLRNLFSEGHVYIIDGLESLARIYVYKENFGEAKELYKEALSLSRNIFGCESLEAAKSLNSLAMFYQEQGAYDEGKILLSEALEITVNSLEGNCFGVGICMGNMASLRVAQGNYFDVEGMFLQAFDIFVESLGVESVYAAKTIDRLRSFISKLVEIQETDILSDHPLTQDLLRQVQEQPPTP